MKRIAILLLLGLSVLVCSCDGDREEVDKKEDEETQGMTEVVNVPAEKVIAGEGVRGLRGYEKDLLGLVYDHQILDTARIHVGKPKDLPKSPLWGLIVQIAVQNDYGVTVGEDMYFPQELDTSKVWGIQWLAHELRHVQQYDQAGELEDFAAGYVWYMMAGVISLEPSSAYLKNPFENDARVFEQCIVELLRKRPELREALTTDPNERNAKVREQIDKYAVEYKQIVGCLLDKAKKAPTKFVVSEQKSFTIDFYLQGQWTNPVGGQIDLRTKSDQ